MNRPDHTVQNGHGEDSGGTDMAAIAVKFSDGIAVDTVATTRVKRLVTDRNDTVYALIARGVTLDMQPAQALLLLRIRDAAKIIASLCRAISESGDGTALAAECGVAVERLRHQKPIGISGELIDHHKLATLLGAEGLDGLLDPQEVADLLAGKVPTQPAAGE